MPKNINVHQAYKDAYGHIDTDASLTFGPFFTYAFLDDPFHLTFQLARHRFVSRILDGKSNVLEIGCQEGFTSLLFKNQFESLVSIDNNEQHISDAKKYALHHSSNLEFRLHDVITDELPENKFFDGAFTVDVLEHIDPSDQHIFISNIIKSLADSATLVIGIPSLEHQQFTSERNKIGHINCKTAEDLKLFCKSYYLSWNNI